MYVYEGSIIHKSRLVSAQVGIISQPITERLIGGALSDGLPPKGILFLYIIIKITKLYIKLHYYTPILYYLLFPILFLLFRY